MVDRDFIETTRIGDDEPVLLRHADIVMVVTNATESGPVEGTVAIYFRHGQLAVAANDTVLGIKAKIAAKEVVQ